MKKLFFITILLCLCFYILTAQVTTFPWNEDFNGGSLPTGWVDLGNAWEFISGSAFTYNYNQMLVTPQLQIPTTPTNRAFFLTYQLLGSFDTVDYEILVSSTGNNDTDFTVEYSEHVSSYNGMTRALDLSQYEGQSIYIAFQRIGGSRALQLYNVWVGESNCQPSIITEFPWIVNFSDILTTTSWISNEWSLDRGYAATQSSSRLLITPQLQLPTTPADQAEYLTYRVWSGSSNSTVDYNILVSTTGNDTQDFTIIDSQSITGDIYQSLALNLSQYEEQPIYIAFQRVSGGASLNLDDIWVGECPIQPSVITEFPWSEGFTDILTVTNWAVDGWSFSSGYAFTRSSNGMLITPQLQLPTSVTNHEMLMRYRVISGSSSTAYYEILVSTTGSNVADFFVEESLYVTGDSFQSRTLNLSQYEGQSIYIAFQRTGSGGPLLLEDVWVGFSEQPQNLAATPGASTVSLSWSPPASAQGLLYYLVYRRAESMSGFTPISGSVYYTSYTDSGLENGVTYYYYVTAVFASGESTPSNIVSATPFTEVLILPPTNLVASITQLFSVFLNWEAPEATGITNYKIFRRASNTEEFAQIYQTTNSTTLTYNDTDVVVGTTYQYYVTAVYPQGESAWSNIVFVVYFYRLPPANLVADVTDQLSISLSWEAPNSIGFQNYKVYRRASSADTFALVHQTADETTFTYNDTAVDAGTTYQYCVTAVYPNGESSQSNIIFVVFYFTLPPSNLVADVTATQTVALSWVAPDAVGLQYYKVYRKTGEDGEFVELHQTIDNTTLSFVDTQVVERVTYQYYVTGVYPTGESGLSNIASAFIDPLTDNDVVGLAVTKLSGNYPNPFNPTTSIVYEMASNGYVVIDVYNNKGQKIRSLVNGERGAGLHKVVWDGIDDSEVSVSSGIYFYRMSAGEYVGVKKMLLLK